MHLDCNDVLPEKQTQKSHRLPVTEINGISSVSFQQNAPEAMLLHTSGAFSLISVFGWFSVYFTEGFFQADHRFFDDLCLISGTVRQLLGHPAVKHRLCLFDLDAEQLVRRAVQCVDDVDLLKPSDRPVQTMLWFPAQV